MSADHEYYESLILRLPDGDLDDGETEALRSHLASCPDCRRLFTALRAATEDLDGTDDPPAGLTAGVMDRVLTDAVKRAASAASADRRRQSARRRRLRSFGAFAGVAAVLAIAVGGGLYLSRGLLGHVSSSAVQQSAAMDAGFAPTVVTAPLPEPVEAVAPAAGEPAEAETALFTADGAPAAMEEAALAENGMEAAETSLAAAAPVSSDDPAAVPEGREADFEALIAAARWDDGKPLTPWQTIAYVEYRGVIYEFLSDPDGEYLLWRDAAEGAEPNLSPGQVSSLWDILG